MTGVAGLPAAGLTADEFIAWSTLQPKGRRYELLDGKIVQMAAERLRHALTKHAAVQLLADAIAQNSLLCQAYPDGVAVRVDATTVYEPDAAVRCGAPLDLDTVIYADPVIVVEVLSPSTQGLDASMKLADYFRIPSVQHYLIVRPDRPLVIHHRRVSETEVATRFLTSGALELTPSGLTIDVAGLFPRPGGSEQT